MKTHTAPWDYERIVKIVPQPEKLCLDCGGYVYLRPILDPGTEAWACVSCGGGQYTTVMEDQADDFRAQQGLGAELAAEWEEQIELANKIVANPERYFDLSDLIGNEEGSDNRMSTGMRENLDY